MGSLLEVRAEGRGAIECTSTCGVLLKVAGKQPGCVHRSD